MHVCNYTNMHLHVVYVKRDVRVTGSYSFCLDCLKNMVEAVVPLAATSAADSEILPASPLYTFLQLFVVVVQCTVSVLERPTTVIAGALRETQRIRIVDRL